MRTIIVDGYNVMHAIPSLRLRIDRGEADQGRKELIDALAVMAGQRKAQVILVFDGVVPHGIGTARVRLVSSRTRSADAIIRDEARRQGQRLTVVSADREIVDTARACMAAVWSPDQLATELSLTTLPPSSTSRRSPPSDGSARPHRLDELRERSEKPGDPGDDDIEEWKRLFGA